MGAKCWRARGDFEPPTPDLSLVTPNYPADRSSPGAAAVLFSNSFASQTPTSALPNPSKCIMALSASYLEIEVVALVDGK